MKGVFITGFNIQKVRHLSGINIPLSQYVMKNLIITGKNGSGKTSVLKAIANHLEYIVSNNFYTKAEIQKYLLNLENGYQKIKDSNVVGEKESYIKSIRTWRKYLEYWEEGCIVECTSIDMLREKYASGQFILAYYGDDRKVEISEYENIEKIALKTVYGIKDTPSKDLGKYLVNLKRRTYVRANLDRYPELAPYVTV